MGLILRWKNGGLWELQEMVIWNEENEGEEEQFRKSEGKGKRKGKRTCLK